MGFKETMTYFEKCIIRTALVALSAPPPGVINCVCVCVWVFIVRHPGPAEIRHERRVNILS